jgi:hypothetical protein
MPSFAPASFHKLSPSRRLPRTDTYPGTDHYKRLAGYRRDGVPLVSAALPSLSGLVAAWDGVALLRSSQLRAYWIGAMIGVIGRHRKDRIRVDLNGTGGRDDVRLSALQ